MFSPFFRRLPSSTKLAATSIQVIGFSGMIVGVTASLFRAATQEPSSNIDFFLSISTSACILGSFMSMGADTVQGGEEATPLPDEENPTLKLM